MAVLTVAPKSDFIPLESGAYTLTLTNYKIRDREPDKFHTKPWQDVEFLWDVAVSQEIRENLGLGTEPIERRSWESVPRTFSDKSGMVKLAIALGVVDQAEGAESGAEFDLDAWLGKKCKGLVEEFTKQDGTLGDKITSYSPFRGRAPAPTQAAQAAKPAPARRVAPQPPVEEDPEGDMPF